MTIKSESLNTAIEMEEKGYNFYTESAEKTDNKFSQQVLESLAEQELKHKNKFQELAEGNDVTTEDMDSKDIEEQIKGFFEEVSDTEKEEWKYKLFLRVKTTLA